MRSHRSNRTTQTRLINALTDSRNHLPYYTSISIYIHTTIPKHTLLAHPLLKACHLSFNNNKLTSTTLTCHVYSQSNHPVHTPHTHPVHTPITSIIATEYLTPQFSVNFTFSSRTLQHSNGNYSFAEKQSNGNT